MKSSTKFFLSVLAGVLGSVILAIVAGVSGAGWWSMLILFLGWAITAGVSGWWLLGGTTRTLVKGIGRK